MTTAGYEPNRTGGAGGQMGRLFPTTPQYSRMVSSSVSALLPFVMSASLLLMFYCIYRLNTEVIDLRASLQKLLSEDEAQGGGPPPSAPPAPPPVANNVVAAAGAPEVVASDPADAGQ